MDTNLDGYSKDHMNFNGHICWARRIENYHNKKCRNGVILQPWIVFGNNQNLLNKPVIALSNNELIYQAGQNFVMLNIKNNC